MQTSLTAQLVTDALMMAIWRRGKPDALLHHSDRGSQHTSEQFQRLLGELGVTCSMSRSGNVWDNSAMESFFSTHKTERTARRTYRTRSDAKANVFDYIERFYNTKWQHEYKSDLQAITARFADDPTQTSFSLTGVPLDNSFFRAGAGFSMVLPHGRS